MMKKLIVLVIVAGAAFSCKKGEVPQICRSFEGEWHGVKSSQSTWQITIKGDGTGSFSDNNSNGSGNVYFDGFNFKIGKNKRKNTKFTTDTLPHRITITVNPYTYYQKATFNGITYSDRPQ